MQARAHLLIRGQVQGVYYRGFARDLAMYHGLKGWVRNLSNGSVEAVFEGSKGDIEQVISSCQSGPPGARVDDININWEDYQGDLRDFQIRYY